MQHTDIQFDNVRQTVQYNVPVAQAAYRSAEQHFVLHGSAHDVSMKQAQAMIGGWTHANSRAFALETVMRDLALYTAAAMIWCCCCIPSAGTPLQGSRLLQRRPLAPTLENNPNHLFHGLFG